MYYLVNKQATTLTFYFEDGTQDFGLEQLFNLSRHAFAETIAPLWDWRAHRRGNGLRTNLFGLRAQGFGDCN